MGRWGLVGDQWLIVIFSQANTTEMIYDDMMDSSIPKSTHLTKNEEILNGKLHFLCSDTCDSMWFNL